MKSLDVTGGQVGPGDYERNSYLSEGSLSDRVAMETSPSTNFR